MTVRFSDGVDGEPRDQAGTSHGSPRSLPKHQTENDLAVAIFAILDKTRAATTGEAHNIVRTYRRSHIRRAHALRFGNCGLDEGGTETAEAKLAADVVAEVVVGGEFEVNEADRSVASKEGSHHFGWTP